MGNSAQAAVLPSESRNRIIERPIDATRDDTGLTSNPFAGRPRIRVVKLGGSLADTPFLLRWLEVISNAKKGRVVIVPGGGAFADQVRASQKKWKFDDRTAHRMALLAMQQYGLMLASFHAGFRMALTLADIPVQLRQSRVTVWMPDVRELDRAAIPPAWEITSDSLSAWLAGQVGAEKLVVVKSCRQSCILAGPKELARQGILDPAFPGIWEKSGVALKLYHSGDYQAFAEDMDGVSRSGYILPSRRVRVMGIVRKKP